MSEDSRFHFLLKSTTIDNGKPHNGFSRYGAFFLEHPPASELSNHRQVLTRHHAARQRPHRNGTCAAGLQCLTGDFAFGEPMNNSNHRSHGWNNDTVVPDWPPLELGEVEALLSGFPALGKPIHIAWHSPRPFSATARVATAAGDVFVKRHHQQVRTVQALLEEHAFIAHLRTQAIAVPQVLANAAGQTAVARGAWVFEVHTPATGTDLYRDTPSWTPLAHVAQARNAGSMLAQLHHATASFTLPNRSAVPLVARDAMLRTPDLISAIAAYPALVSALAHRPWRHELVPLLARHRALQSRLQTQPRLWTHGDWHASNLLWDGNGSAANVTSVLDFGLCAPTFALYDLATAIERNAIAWLQLGSGVQEALPHIAVALLEGYAEVSPLAPSDVTLLADLLPLVHLDFALSELEYFHAVLHQATMVDIVWNDYLLGHAAWFETAHAKPLLHAIQLLA